VFVKEGGVGDSRLVIKNVVARQGRTSMRLEPELWSALEELCRREQTSLAQMVRQIEDGGAPGSRTSAVRVQIVRYFRAAATEAGHREAGHREAGQGFRRQRSG